MISCEQYNLPKQKGYLAHQFNKPEYELINTDCNFSFMTNKNQKLNTYPIAILLLVMLNLKQKSLYQI